MTELHHCQSHCDCHCTTILESLKAEGEVIIEDVQPSIGQHRSAASPPTDNVTFTVEEKLNVSLKRDGGVSNFDVQGALSLQILKKWSGHLVM